MAARQLAPWNQNVRKAVSHQQDLNPVQIVLLVLSVQLLVQHLVNFATLEPLAQHQVLARVQIVLLVLSVQLLVQHLLRIV